MKPKQMSGGWWEPILFDQFNRGPRPYRPPIYALDDATKPEVLLVGPRGETLISRGSRRLGFRPPR